MYTGKQLMTSLYTIRNIIYITMSSIYIITSL